MSGADFQSKFFQSIRFKITFGIVAILSLILLILGHLTIREQRERMMVQMRNYGTEIADFVAQISVVPIKKFSIYQLENYVAQLETGQLIAYCEIYDNAGSPLAHSAARSAGGLLEQKGDDILKFSAVIKDGNSYLGRVDLGLELRPVLTKIDQTSLYITIAFWVELVVIALAVSLFVHKSFVSPLLRLTSVTSKIAAGRFITSSQAVRRDEIGVLAKTINVMSNTLEESYRTLELKVAERTAELNEAKNASEESAKHLKLVSSELQVLLDNSPVGILFVSSDRTIHRVNQEFTRIFGFTSEEVVGKTTRLLYDTEGEFRDAVETTYKVILRDGFCQTTLKMRKKDGLPVVCALRGRIISRGEQNEGIVWCLEDITYRLKMEEELLKVKKLESIGVLAGGIAHDFNNILVAIIGNISLAERMLENAPKISDLLQNAKNASMRAKDLTIKLLTFSKGGVPVKSIEHLPEVIEDSASFVLSGSNVKCVNDFEEGLWPVPMDKGQINQVVQNLILNADQSMPEGGTVRITCRNIEVSENEIPNVRHGRYVCVKITDTGAGIDPRHINNIFDPYFSTKEKSSEKGSGLGLSIVHSIVSKHGGSISVRSTPNSGTEFTLHLPAAFVEKNEDEKDGGESFLVKGRGRVMVMDDEENIRVVAQEMLSYLGYQAVLAANGEEAIEMYRQYFNTEEAIDIIIMDLTVPGGIGGETAVKKVLEIDKNAKVIVSSGYSDNSVVHNYRKAGFVNTISKPYQLADLSDVLSQTMKL